MNGLAIKSLCGVVACGGIVGGGFLVKRSFFSEDKSLAKKLKDEKYTLLSFDNSNDSHWGNIVDAYKAQTTNNTSLKIKDTTIIGKTESDLTAMKKACKSIIESDFSKDNYNLAIKWCVVPETVVSRISKNEKKVLKLDSTDEKEKPSWTSLIASYRSETSVNKKFTDLNLSEATSGSTNTDSDINNLREKCKGIKDKKTYEFDYESSYQKINDFCSVKI